MRNKEITINISEKTYHQLEDLRDLLELNSISDIIKSSVALTKLIAENKKKGNKIIIKDTYSKIETIIGELN